MANIKINSDEQKIECERQNASEALMKAFEPADDIINENETEYAYSEEKSSSDKKNWKIIGIIAEIGMSTAVALLLRKKLPSITAKLSKVIPNSCKPKLYNHKIHNYIKKKSPKVFNVHKYHKYDKDSGFRVTRPQNVSSDELTPEQQKILKKIIDKNKSEDIEPDVIEKFFRDGVFDDYLDLYK